MKNRLRKLRRFLAVAGLIGLLVVAFTAYWPVSFWIQPVVDAAQSKCNEPLWESISLESAKFSLLRGFKAHKITLQGKNWVLQTQNIHVTWTWMGKGHWAPHAQGFKVQTLSILALESDSVKKRLQHFHGNETRVERKPISFSNLSDELPACTHPWLAYLAQSRIEVADGEIQWEPNAKDALQFQAAILEVIPGKKNQGESGRAIHIRVSTQHFKVGKFSGDSLKTSLQLNQDALHISKTTLSTLGGRLSLKGHSQGRRAAEFSLQVTGSNLQLSQLVLPAIASQARLVGQCQVSFLGTMNLDDFMSPATSKKSSMKLKATAGNQHAPEWIAGLQSLKGTGSLSCAHVSVEGFPFQTQGFMYATYPGMRHIDFDSLSLPQIEWTRSSLKLNGLRGLGSPLSFTGQGQIEYVSGIQLGLRARMDSTGLSQVGGLAKHALRQDEIGSYWGCTLSGDWKNQALGLTSETFTQALSSGLRRIGKFFH